MNEMTDQDLLDALGVEAKPKKKAAHTARDERIVAGFEEIQAFVDAQGHVPAQDKDIFERLYATRLDRIRSADECRQLVQEMDHQGLLERDESVIAPADKAFNSDEELLSELGISIPKEGDVTFLKHVKPRAEVRAAEEVATRKPCDDFDVFAPVFEAVREELKSGVRITKPFRDNAEIREKDLFILSGQTVYVAEIGEEFITEYDRKDSRLRVLYDNGTESDILLRSLQRALNKDEAGRRIIDISPGPLFSDNTENEDFASGTIYVLRSKSDHPTIQENRDVIHKIGVTGGTVERRIANANSDPTYLMADVDIVATYELYNINRAKLERVLHRFFDGARLDIQIADRFGKPVRPQEWFLVPVFILDEVVEKIKEGTIGKYKYDAETVTLVERQV